MAGYSDLRSFVQTCVLLAFVIAVHAVGQETCDKTSCIGPLRYYEELGCTPVYKNQDNCCAETYDCSYLKELSEDKCYVNGHEYSIGEALREEDANPCDIGCRCSSFNNKTASFLCAAVDCPFRGPVPTETNCFDRNSPTQCCPGPFVCMEEGEKRATCEVDGKTYLDGEAFSPKSDPDLECYCMPGYTGKNIEPFCKKPNHPYCSPLFRNAGEVHRKCVPVFYENQNPQKDCSVYSICQDQNDVVVDKHDSTKTASTEVQKESDNTNKVEHVKTQDKENKMCLFGNVTMHIGEELHVSTTYDCAHCKCEVPPVPTCQRLEYEHCTR